MIPLSITPNIEKAPWSDLSQDTRRAGLGVITRIGRLPSGTTAGKSTVTVLIRMPDGRELMAETTMALFSAAAGALIAADNSPEAKAAGN